MKELNIYFKDQQMEKSKIESIVGLVDTEYDIRMTQAKPMLENSGFDEFPVVEINRKLYSYSDALDILKSV